MRKINIKNFRRESSMMLVSVICLTLTMISVSYGIFFDVKTNDNEQVITTGDLSVQFTGSSTSLTGVYLYPYTDEEGILSSSQSIFYVQNGGSVNASFTFTITENSEHTLSNEYIKLAVFEYNASDRSSTQISDIVKLSDAVIDENGNFIIYTSTVSSGESATYSLKFWLDENCPEEIINEDADLSINVLSEALEAVMLYNLSGTLSDSTGNISGATISLNNGSYSSVTSSSGYYTLNGIRAGTYLSKITLIDGTSYIDTIKVQEATAEYVTSSSGVFTVNGAYDKNVSLNITLSSTGISSMEIN